jgi:hypothetical protein
MAESLDHRDFAPHVGKLFRFPRHNVALRLVKIERHDAFAEPDAERAPFSLTFHGPANDLLPEGSYPAQVEGGAVLEFHVMPVHTQSRDRQDYQAVFN